MVSWSPAGEAGGADGALGHGQSLRDLKQRYEPRDWIRVGVQRPLEAAGQCSKPRRSGQFPRVGLTGHNQFTGDREVPRYC